MAPGIAAPSRHHCSARSGAGTPPQSRDHHDLRADLARARQRGARRRNGGIAAGRTLRRRASGGTGDQGPPRQPAAQADPGEPMRRATASSRQRPSPRAVQARQPAARRRRRHRSIPPPRRRRARPELQTVCPIPPSRPDRGPDPSAASSRLIPGSGAFRNPGKVIVMRGRVRAWPNAGRRPAFGRLVGRTADQADGMASLTRIASQRARCAGMAKRSRSADHRAFAGGPPGLGADHLAGAVLLDCGNSSGSRCRRSG